MLDAVVCVREIKSADAAEVAQIHADARSAYYSAAGVEQVEAGPVSYGERTAMWEHIIAESMTTVLGAEDDGGLVGFIAWSSTSKASAIADFAIELVALYVGPECWGRRVGGRLHERFVAHLNSQTVGFGVLEVWARNERALGFYRRRGWHRQGNTRPGPLGAPFVTLQLTR